MRFNGGEPIPLVYGSQRPDVLNAGACASDEVGFVAIWNWANLGDGTHTAVVYDNGVEFARSTFQVTTLGEPFVRGASGQCTIQDFPSTREAATFKWNQNTQHLEIVPGRGTLNLPLRAIHASGNWADNREIADTWEAAGRVGPLVPPDYIDWLNSLSVNWIGLSVALHYADSTDSTVERVYSGVRIPTFSDVALRQLIREFRSYGIHVYLTLAFESHEAEEATRPVRRWQLGDPGKSDTGVPPDDPNVFGLIRPEFWPWRPNHPDHNRFVAEFWETYTQQAVHFARIAEEEGVGLFSLGTETDRLFRTRSGGDYWPNHFRQELKSMVVRVRSVYSGALTYDMHADALTAAHFFDPGSKHLWEDLALDIIGLSAWFSLADSPPSAVLSVANLSARWEQIFQDYLIPLQDRNPNRPIVFTEYGMIDTVAAPANPGDWSPQHSPFVLTDANGNGLDDGRETQANSYQALINTIARHPGVLNGFFPWDNWIASDAQWTEYQDERTYSIRNKPAEEVVRTAYEGYKQR